MGEHNIVFNDYISVNERFADLYNVALFEGEKIVRAEDLMDMDTKAWRRKGRGERKECHEYIRDQLKQWKCGPTLLVLGLEPEDSVQYALPVKFMNYESVQYQKNLHKIKNAHRKNRDLSREEFISGFSRTDKLQPVITLGIYMGKKKWDAPENLHGLLDWGVFPQKIRKQLMRCCNDFHVNMLDVNKLSSSEVFCSDLREVFGFLMRQNDKKALREFVQENEEFRHLKEDAYDVIAAFSNTRELRIAKETYRTEGGMDMCLAIQEMIQDGIDEGMEKGIEKGINRINILISRLAEDGRTEDLVRSARDADYQKKLLKEYHI